MIIVLEGCDLAGKSTLAKHLNLRTGLPIIRKGPPRQHPLFEYEPKGKWTGICDRWHLGETVYGPILRGQSNLDKVQLWHVCAYLKARGAFVVLVHPPLDVILERYDAEGDEMIRRDQLEDIHRAYDEMITHHVRDISLVTSNPVEFTDLVVHKAQNAWDEAKPVREHYGLRTYVGPRYPTVLIVGDRRHRGDESRFNSSFVPMPNTSGHFLMWSIYVNPERDVRTKRIGFINANESNADDFYDAWLVLGRPMIVSVGANAHNKLAHLRIPHGAVPHPQFVKRFHHEALLEYGEVLWRALNEQSDMRSWRP